VSDYKYNIGDKFYTLERMRGDDIDMLHPLIFTHIVESILVKQDGIYYKTKSGRLSYADFTEEQLVESEGNGWLYKDPQELYDQFKYLIYEYSSAKCREAAKQLGIAP